jgi:hypothetical protein
MLDERGSSRLVGVIAALHFAACMPEVPDSTEIVFASRPSPGVRVPARDSLHAHPARVGQWALYRISDGASIGYEYVDVTQGQCGVWFEVVWVARGHRTVSKVCYRTMPDLDHSTERWLPLTRVAVTQRDDGVTTVFDLQAGDGVANQRFIDLCRFQSTFDGARWRHDDLPREDVDAIAGQFAGAVRVISANHDLKMWFHPDVPLTGLVRSHARDGTDLELVSFGEQGATSGIPDVALSADGVIVCTDDLEMMPGMECRIGS